MLDTEFASYIRLKTKTNSTTLTDANIILLANIHSDQIANRVLNEADENYFGAPETTDMVNAQREYPFPTDMLNHIKKVEAVLDPTILDVDGNLVWRDMKEIDLSHYNRTTDEPTIVREFDNTYNYRYMIYRNALWIMSGTLANFIAGNNYLKIWTFEWPVHLSVLNSGNDLSFDPTNTSCGIPTPLHLPWADRVVLAWKQTSDKQYQMDDYEQGMETRETKAIMSLVGEDLDRSFTMSYPVSDDQGRGDKTHDNGFNL